MVGPWLYYMGGYDLEYRRDIVASGFSAWLVFGNGIGMSALGKRRHAVGIVSVS